jgi:sugar phosphate permease
VTATAKFLRGKDRRWQMLALLFVVFALCYVDRQAAFSIFPVLKKELGFSDTQLGLVGSLFGWSYALFRTHSRRCSP